MILLTALKLTAVWLTYEVGIVGTQITRGIIREQRRDRWHEQSDEWLKPDHNQADYPQYYKKPYVPPTIIFKQYREEYLKWEEWKGDRFQ
ncbi:hypothetical protein PU629_07445 [Pullulanibacillus sp. KACC 23026]|uniref:hypothetical protein n=1 Tax=Pullulanibacillus sp. KACC 23026 TaxID=3028315 RepID=UPI0023AFA7A4|nr:hypothetical protein [Pullulanibacillus sp. KACC 23026]WEG14192.1 hypothetical protein PU629_07445 [Pullulanibacillus sp. KACC 23026]